MAAEDEHKADKKGGDDKPKKAKNAIEEATGYELKELAKAPLKSPKAKIDNPPKGGYGLTAAAVIGLFFFAIIVGLAINWLTAALILLIGTPLLGLVFYLVQRLGAKPLNKPGDGENNDSAKDG